MEKIQIFANGSLIGLSLGLLVGVVGIPVWVAT